MQDLRDLARRLLAEGTVGVVIGYEEGPRGLRPAFVTRPEDADRLAFDRRAVHNLAVYLDPRRRAVRALGRPAVVVKTCDARAVAGLIRESQLRREDVVLIGVRCPGVQSRPEATAAKDTAPRCFACTERETGLADFLVGEPQARTVVPPSCPPEQPAGPWSFWQSEFSRCTRCYACRAVCPLCYCARCLAEQTRPQWIESSPHGRGNVAWHVSRALHLAGRCVGCGECERACPAGIPLGRIAGAVAESVRARFDYRAVDDPAVPAPIGAFRPGDAQEFIL